MLLISLVIAGSPPEDDRLLRVCNRLIAESLEPQRPETVVVVLETTPDCDLDGLVGECSALGVDVQVVARVELSVRVEIGAKSWPTPLQRDETAAGHLRRRAPELS